MARTKPRKKMVRFYEVQNENQESFPRALPWEQFLDRLSQQSVKDRQHSVDGVDHWCRTYTVDERDHLVMARAREDAVSSLNIAQDDIVDMDSEVGRPYVELSIVSFVPGTNYFGFMLGSQASSRVGSLEKWINLHKEFNAPITISPLLSKDAASKIMNADEIKVIQVKYSGDQLGSVRRQSRIGDALQVLEEGHGGVEIELILRATGKVTERKRPERRRLLETARSVFGDPYKKASAEVINYDAEGVYHTEHVDFINDALARKMTVSVRDEEGNPVRIPSAITAIERAAMTLRDEFLDR